MHTSLVWFRLDLRLDDNPALIAAAERGPAIPVFIWAPDEENPWPPGAASRWWLHQSLTALQSRLESIGLRLIVRRGSTMGALQGLVSETGATAVFWNRRYEPAVISRDGAVKSCLRDRGIEAESFAGNLLFEPWTVQSKSAQEPFQLFKAYWKACLNIQPAPPRDAPRRIAAPARWPQSAPGTGYCRVDAMRALPDFGGPLRSILTE